MAKASSQLSHMHSTVLIWVTLTLSKLSSHMPLSRQLPHKSNGAQQNMHWRVHFALPWSLAGSITFFQYTLRSDASSLWKRRRCCWSSFVKRRRQVILSSTILWQKQEQQCQRPKDHSWSKRDGEGVWGCSLSWKGSIFAEGLTWETALLAQVN